METATTVKRPRGRPRLDAPPRAAVNVRLRPEVRAQLERDAKRATRSVTKEISVRIEKSYVSDEMFGGPQMASMFREMATAALGVERQKSFRSLFEDFETFVLVKDIWQRIIQRQMPRPADELLAEIGRNWDAVKAGAPQPAAQQAARELIQRAPISGSYASSVSLSPIGNLDMVIQHLIPLKGSARAAAQEVSRLAQLLAEMTEGEAADDTAVPRVEPDDSIAAAPGE
jgi:hypothetical protein